MKELVPKFSIWGSLSILLVSPLLAGFEAEKNQDESIPNIDSEAHILYDLNAEQVLHEHNSDEKMYPASITKIVTALAAIEHTDSDETVEVSHKAANINGSRVYLLEDEEISAGQLIEGLMIASGNDTAIALAEHISGSVEQFADKMNRYLEEDVGVENTHMTNPHGLYDEDHYTTAADMAKISEYAMENDAFRELAETEMVEWESEEWDTNLFNHHDLVREYDEIKGVKNGYTRKSGATLATFAEHDNRELLTVTLNAPSGDIAQEDTKNLFRYGYNMFDISVLDFSDEQPILGYEDPDELVVAKKENEDLDWEINSDSELLVYGEEQGHITSYPLKSYTPINTVSSLNRPSPDESAQSESGFIKTLLDRFVATGYYGF
ncbi:D-alanyl-D-alanine carboxypeptidase family protein [Salisediminibacterium halotolerans]|uniref:D-alanyl-D-alanine carboxypeptidase/D-alanyl-D-alanine carboxypeptidase (Penicillin-binding protein 5/6) n=1 Tax=Salisediminibacterium halotolerans TaxID=517425 RepID=A0A1H9WGH1_9BACI|nr:D-alanyl-D-alanine carboxypeptidase family protein [Salisediminibacterium haloalkalitolerans]SES32777.1 D-alanyl-D-alanine carboxypeptidase/D-alanyl-D-alanine carboxypeptidase (penicillin-binding protein 5/6) [Salisediminibacterium haloalkalitolerans]